MARLRFVPKPSILRHTARSQAGLASPSRGDRAETERVSRAETRDPATLNAVAAPDHRARLTFTGTVAAVCMLPLRAIIRACVRLGIHPNILTFVGVVINVAAAWALALGRFLLAGIIMIAANIFDFIDGKVAHQLQLESRFGAFWDSTLDRFSD